jgi:hypothetical protein
MIAYGRSLWLAHFTRYRQLAHYYRYALAYYYRKWVAHSRQWLDMLTLQQPGELFLRLNDRLRLFR